MSRYDAVQKLIDQSQANGIDSGYGLVIRGDNLSQRSLMVRGSIWTLRSK